MVYRVTEVSSSGLDVSYEMFGANGVYNANSDNGAPHPTFTDSLKALGITHVRFPAGQGDNADATAEGTGWLNVVRMENGDLNADLKRFLDWCLENNITASLVIPTKHLSASEYEAFGPEITAFAKKLLQTYPDIVTAFEIGNEYWEMGETAYAAKTNIAVQALETAFDDLGLSANAAPDTLVQMATPNAGSEFTANAPGMEGIGYRTRIDMANEKIISELDANTLAAIDGLVEHYYYKRSGNTFTDHENEVNYISRDISYWHAALGRDVPIHITEWNVQADNMAQTGLRSTAVMSFQIEEMLRMGVDAAQIWAVQHNTTSDLTGPSGQAPLTDEEGRVESTVRGALFDLLAEALPGKELLNLDFETTVSDAYVSAYASTSEMVLIISSRLETAKTFTFDFGTRLDEFQSISGAKVSIDMTDQPGSHWDPKQRAFVTPDGADLSGNGIVDFYYGEHDLRADITDFTAPALMMNGDLSFDLNPFETMVITLEDPENGKISNVHRDPPPGSDDNTGGQATVRSDMISETLWFDLDNDRMTGGDGNDWMYGGSGSDTLTGGAGNDIFEFRDGSLENDVITDFDVIQDTLLFQIDGVTSLSDLYIVNDGSDVEVSITGQSGSVRLEGVSRSELLSSDDAIDF